MAQRRAEQEKQLATAGEEDLQPVQAGPEKIPRVKILTREHNLVTILSPEGSGLASAGGDISMGPTWR